MRGIYFVQLQIPFAQRQAPHARHEKFSNGELNDRRKILDPHPRHQAGVSCACLGYTFFAAIPFSRHAKTFGRKSLDG